MQGKVRWFNARRGYGFIARQDGGRDLFVHFTGIVMDGYRTLRSNDEVDFDIVEGPKGEQAGNVKVLKEGVKEKSKTKDEGGMDNDSQS